MFSSKGAQLLFTLSIQMLKSFIPQKITVTWIGMHQVICVSIQLNYPDIKITLEVAAEFLMKFSE